MLIFVGGCDNQEIENEFSNKTEFSILEHYEYIYRNADQNKPFMIFEHAMNSDYTVVAFPIKDKSKGYVVLLAKAEGEPKIKVLLNVNFVVTQEAYTAVNRKVSLSKEVDQFIASHVQK